MALLLRLLPPLHCSSSLPTLFLLQRSIHLSPFTIYSPYSSRATKISNPRPRTVSLALTESGSPSSLDPDPETLLQELADSFDLPPDYLGQLPRDLRLDLNDAAFDLSNGSVIDECGQELGEVLLNLSRAWELADTSASRDLARKLPFLGRSLPNRAKSALSKRLSSAGRRFQSMGQYGQGELQRVPAILIAKAMTTAGKLLSAHLLFVDTQPKAETRVLKFGELQVEVTPGKAYAGAAISLIFGVLSWQLSQGVQSIQETSLQYANDNALMLAKSLRGALLAIFYSSTLLSGFTSVGLVLLGRQLESKEK